MGLGIRRSVVEKVDLAIAPEVPEGFLGEPLMIVRFLPVASPSHPLHALDRVTLSDLRNHHHLVIRDSSSRRETAGAWNVTQNRITFSQTSTSIEAVRRGIGFGWYAEMLIGPDLAAGTLKPLPLAGGGERFGELYLIFRDAEGAAPGAKHLAYIIREIAHRGEADNTLGTRWPRRSGSTTFIMNGKADANTDAGPEASSGSETG